MSSPDDHLWKGIDKSELKADIKINHNLVNLPILKEQVDLVAYCLMKFNIKRKQVDYQSLMLAENKIYIFLKNSFVLKFNLNGELSEIDKLPEKIKSKPIIIDSSLIFLNKMRIKKGLLK